MTQNLRWFYSTDESSQIGPLTFAEIKSLVRAGKIHQSAHVWREDWPNWRRLSSVEELEEDVPLAPPPLPDNAWRTDVRPVRTTLPKSVKAKRVVSWIATWGLLLILMIIFKAWLDWRKPTTAPSRTQSTGITQEQLELLAAERNKALPQRMDSITTWKAVSVGPNTITYIHEIDESALNLLDATVFSNLDAENLSEACSPSGSPLVDRGVTFQIVYVSPSGSQLHTFSMSKDDCS